MGDVCWLKNSNPELALPPYAGSAMCLEAFSQSVKVNLVKPTGMKHREHGFDDERALVLPREQGRCLPSKHDASSKTYATG